MPASKPKSKQKPKPNGRQQQQAAPTKPKPRGKPVERPSKPKPRPQPGPERLSKVAPATAPAPAIEVFHALDLEASRLTDEQRELLLMLLAAGTRERALLDFWQMAYGREIASSTLSYYRQKCREEIEARKLARMEAALASGLALKAERVAALKEHAELLGAIRFVPDANGKLWNERAWRQTLAEIAEEMGDRKPKDGQQGEQTIKVYVGIDPDRV